MRLVLLLAAAAAAEQTSVFNVQIPADLRKADGYRHKEAMFGAPTYNKMISQRLYWSNSTLCHGYQTDEWKPPYILMVDRGECSFVSKVRVAQNMGASAVVVADNACVCGDTCHSDGLQACESKEPIMADDGSGQDISIPAILMWKSDADAIKDYLRDRPNAVIQASLDYTLPDPDDRVEWQLWTTAIDQVAESFLVNFKNTAFALGQSQFFAPHAYTYNGSDFGCTSPWVNCGNLCTNDGRYCAPDPDGYFNRGISGADVVRENLRRICLWDLYGLHPSDSAQFGVGREWWHYVGNFSALCGTLEKFADPNCVESALTAAGADVAKVNECVVGSGGADPDGGANLLLDAELTLMREWNIYMIPECIVNTKPIWGALSTGNVLNTICEGFSPGDQPDACECQGLEYAEDLYNLCLSDARAALYATDDVDARSSSSPSKKSTTTSGVAWWAVVLLSMLIVVAMLVAGLLYWKKTQQHMRDQVRGILSEYLPLEELGADGHATGVGFNDHNNGEVSTNHMHSLSIQA